MPKSWVAENPEIGIFPHWTYNDSEVAARSVRRDMPAGVRKRELVHNRDAERERERERETKKKKVEIQRAKNLAVFTF